MKLVVVSYKVCWIGKDGYVTFGGFPQQVSALSRIFDSTTLLILEREPPPPEGAIRLSGENLRVSPRREPRGTGVVRKLRVIPWMAGNMPRITMEICRADSVHAVVPGDVGVLGLLVSLALRKRTFVRHCGTWGDRSTLFNRFIAWLLPRVAGRRVVVMATGGGPELPEPGNPSIQWIFATSLSQKEIENIVPAAPWRSGEGIRLITVGRLTPDKNALACIEALPAIREVVPGSTLRVVGDGPFRYALEEVVERLGLAKAVTFTGNVDHEAVVDALRNSHVFVFPTREAEGFPKAVIEAMACGLPVVASRVSVLPHLLGEGTGVLLDGTSSDDVARAVINLVQEPGQMADMGRKGREIARDYTLERWRALIHERLEAAWGRPLKSGPRSQAEGEPAA